MTKKICKPGYGLYSTLGVINFNVTYFTQNISL